MELKTVKVASPVSDDNPTGYVVINETDFDPAVHTLFGDEVEPAIVAWKAKTKAELQAHLDDVGVAYDSTYTKADLIALCEAVPSKAVAAAVAAEVAP